MPQDPPSPVLAAAIRGLREDREITQEDLAHKAGITTGGLSKIEGGLRNPSWTTVERIARALEASLVEFARAVEAEG
jgi:transcriptional regulator with XRE-family HTH domain